MFGGSAHSDYGDVSGWQDPASRSDALQAPRDLADRKVVGKALLVM
ncbi:MAG: hypothetical protein ABSB35_11465 [Bryobacteraceae bacterium]|jgi:hypothetical protein